MLHAFGDQAVVVGEMDMQLQDYLAYLDRSCDEMPLYLFDKRFTDKAPGLLNEFQVHVTCLSACCVASFGDLADMTSALVIMHE